MVAIGKRGIGTRVLRIHEDGFVQEVDSLGQGVLRARAGKEFGLHVFAVSLRVDGVGAGGRLDRIPPELRRQRVRDLLCDGVFRGKDVVEQNPATLVCQGLHQWPVCVDQRSCPGDRRTGRTQPFRAEPRCRANQV